MESKSEQLKQHAIAPEAYPIDESTLDYEGAKEWYQKWYNLDIEGVNEDLQRFYVVARQYGASHALMDLIKQQTYGTQPE